MMTRGPSPELVAAVLRMGDVMDRTHTSAKAVAPRFLRVWETWRSQHPERTFIQFLRECYDHTIPEHAADQGRKRGYLSHPTYRAAAYLQRIGRITHQGSPVHRYKDTEWDHGSCAECGARKDDHLHGEVIGTLPPDPPAQGVTV